MLGAAATIALLPLFGACGAAGPPTATGQAAATAPRTASITLDGDGQVPRDACAQPPVADAQEAASSVAAPPGPPRPIDEAVRPELDALRLVPGAILVDERTDTPVGEDNPNPGIARTYCLPPGTTPEQVTAALAATLGGWTAQPVPGQLDRNGFVQAHRWTRPDEELDAYYGPGVPTLAIDLMRAIPVTGTGSVVVPPLQGSTAAAARARLRRLGLRALVTGPQDTPVGDAQVAVGRVVAQAPGPGSHVARPSTVQLVVVVPTPG